MILTVSEIAERIGAELIGDGSGKIAAVNSLDRECSDEISFIGSGKYVKKAVESKAGSILTAKRIDGAGMPQLVVGNVDSALIAVLNLFVLKLKSICGIHPTAVVEKDAKVGTDVGIGACAYIGSGVKIGDGSVIGPGCRIAENVVIGRGSRLDSNVVVEHGCTIGNNCVIQASSVIGSTGFGYYFIDGEHRLIPHNGSVVIEDCVEIGANSCVDRAKFGNTMIGAGTKIDNLVQIAHNVEIGRLCLLTGQVGLAGSCKLGDGVVLGGHSGVAEHITVGDGVMIGTKSVALNDIPAGRKVWGVPAVDVKEELRAKATLRRLPKMAKQLKDIAKKVEKLTDGNKGFLKI